jgi:uncharacterized protein (DUF2461 family)
MSATLPRFPAGTLSFLRRLKRNNRREWFNAHKEEYERDVRAPMIAVIERLAVDFRSFAPDLVASPKRSLYRIYRDIRFSEDKKPYKTHVAANHRRLRAIVTAPAFRKTVGALEGDRLQRVPRGFPRDHEAAEYLKHRQFLAGAEFPAAFATSPKFYRGLVGVFRSISPLVRFLNEALLQDSGR